MVKRDGTYEAIFQDQLPGRSDNRFFYHVISFDSAGNKSLPGPSTPPLCCPIPAPPDTPVITRILGRKGSILLHWGPRSAEVTSYRIYRTNDLARAQDVRLMNLPYISIPAIQRITVVAGVIRLRSPRGMNAILGVYNRSVADPLASPPHSQPPNALNYWSNAGSMAVMVKEDDGYGVTLYGLDIDKGTEVAIVFIDAQGIERFVDALPLEYIDEYVEPGIDYFYRLIAVRSVNYHSKNMDILSSASNIIRCRSTRPQSKRG